MLVSEIRAQALLLIQAIKQREGQLLEQAEYYPAEDSKGLSISVDKSLLRRLEQWGRIESRPTGPYRTRSLGALALANVDDVDLGVDTSPSPSPSAADQFFDVWYNPVPRRPSLPQTPLEDEKHLFCARGTVFYATQDQVAGGLWKEKRGCDVEILERLPPRRRVRVLITHAAERLSVANHVILPSHALSLVAMGGHSLAWTWTVEREIPADTPDEDISLEKQAGNAYAVTFTRQATTTKFKEVFEAVRTAPQTEIVPRLGEQSFLASSFGSLTGSLRRPDLFPSDSPIDSPVASARGLAALPASSGRPRPTQATTVGIAAASAALHSGLILQPLPEETVRGKPGRISSAWR
eukprot:TRINITY_DN8189_c0_g1_i1.p1 TRINITY_DN8189_c0_g1~~TRINITY_DN8189_c0_g1_i1.p1  ORF type:complete len:352 (-),score=30.72 TRINITY_DN8189_c0_g1_i1:6-1061(-)